MPHFVFDAVRGDHARFANVEDPDFPALQEIMRAEIFPAVDALVN